MGRDFRIRGSGQLQQPLQPLHRLGYLLTVLQTAAVKPIMRLPIEGHPPGKGLDNEIAQFGIRLAPQDRTLRRSHPQTAEQSLFVHIQKDRLPLSVHIVHVVEKARRPSPRRDDHVLKISHLVQHFLLQAPETIFPALGKQLAYRLVEPLFQVPVQIDKRQAQLTGESLSQSRLAGTHIAGQEYTYHHLLCVCVQRYAFAGRCKRESLILFPFFQQISKERSNILT